MVRFQRQGFEVVQKAYDFAKARHGTQKDDNGKPYFTAHVCQATQMLAWATQDPEILAAGYLHDTLEDTKTTLEELRAEFGDRIANLVHEVTKEGSNDEFGYYFPRLKSRDAIMIKFADRLSNISRMQAWSPDRREAYLRKSCFWKDGSELKVK